MAISPAKHRANEKYNLKAYDEIKLRVSPKSNPEKGITGKKDLIRSAAQARGVSVNSFIVGAIDKELERLEAAGVISIFSKEDTNSY